MMKDAQEDAPMLAAVNHNHSVDKKLTMNDNVEIKIIRPAYTQASMIRAYQIQYEEEPSLKEKLKNCAASQLACSLLRCKSRLLRFFPFVGILKNYQWRKWLILDLISGLSVGVIHIPQGMGFSMLTSLPPYYGLYSSLFPVLIYFFFGTSRHISVGTMALISLMIGRVVIREVDNIPPSMLSGNGTASANGSVALDELIDEVRIGTAVSVSLLIGCIQFGMGLLGLGAVVTFMSMPFIGSFLCAAAVHIITSQIPSVFGIVGIKKHSGLFRIPLTCYDVSRRIADANVCSLVTACISLVVLVVLKNVINERFASRLKAPIPAELIVVTVSTLISHYCGLHDRYHMKIVGPIPAGIPAPRAPPMNNALSYVGDAVVAAVVSFVISISMAKLMAKKHGYVIDVNQELYAYGLSHGVSAFFSCFAGAQAPPRTLVHDSVGGKTQVASLFSCVMLLLVCLFLGKLFHSLPIPVLAAVIIVALLPMFKQFQQLPTLWRVNKYDFFVWIVTFLSGVFLDITTGLIVGMATSIVLVVLQARLASGSVMVNLDHSELYMNKERLLSDRIVEHPGIQVFRFSAPLFFANVEKFKAELYEAAFSCQEAILNDLDSDVISLVEMTTEINVGSNNILESGIESKVPLTADGHSHKSGSRVSVESVAAERMQDTVPDLAKPRAIVVDCSAITYIDIMGINMLKMIKTDLLKFNVRCSLACVQMSVAEKLKAAGIVPLHEEDPVPSMFTVYPTVQDAVAMEINCLT